MKNKEILEKLTLEEKAELCTGKDFWHLNGVERLGIPSVTLTDGPHGLSLRKPDGEISYSYLLSLGSNYCLLLGQRPSLQNGTGYGAGVP